MTRVNRAENQKERAAQSKKSRDLQRVPLESLAENYSSAHVRKDTTQVWGKNHPDEAEETISRPHIVCVSTCQSRKSCHHRAPGRVFRRVLLQWWERQFLADFESLEARLIKLLPNLTEF